MVVICSCFFIRHSINVILRVGIRDEKYVNGEMVG